MNDEIRAGVYDHEDGGTFDVVRAEPPAEGWLIYLCHEVSVREDSRSGMILTAHHTGEPAELNDRLWSRLVPFVIPKQTLTLAQFQESMARAFKILRAEPRPLEDKFRALQVSLVQCKWCGGVGRHLDDPCRGNQGGGVL